ncbi:MAG: GNAT family N-acetyltransferase [Actinomycetota bacterium]
MAVEIRIPAENELRAAMQAGEAAFGEETREGEFDRFSKMLPRDRWFAAYDGDRPVGTTTSFPFRLTVPGGELAAGGVTWVGVLPSHRRRGILRDLMKRQLEDVRDRGEPLAILYSSEPLIYGRFGYGVAAPSVSMNGETAKFSYRDDPGPTGAVRIVDAAEALQVLPRVYDEVRRHVAGFVARDSDVWELTRLADPEHWRRGAGPKFFAVIEVDGEPVGYAIYRIKSDWQDGYSQSEVRLVEAIATSAAATRELYRFIYGIDLVVRVHGRYDPGSPLFLMVRDPRSLHLKVSEGLWLRLVDLEAALAGRAYAGDDTVVIEVEDSFCPWNAGRWRVGKTVERTDDEADVGLDTADLASVYLGAFDFNELGAAERARELTPGALQRATDLFRTSRPPYCPEDF